MLRWFAFCFVVLTGVLVGADGGQTPPLCGEHKDAEKGQHEAAPYSFAYQSWVEKKEKASNYEFGCCVENRADHDLFIRWEGTPFNNFVAPNGRLLNTFDWPTNVTITKDRLMWYGPKPDRMTTRLIAKVDVDPARKNDDLKKDAPLATQDLPYAQAVPLTSKTRSTIRIGDRIKSVEVLFESDVLLLGETTDRTEYLYRITWHGRWADDQPVNARLELGMPQWSLDRLGDGTFLLSKATDPRHATVIDGKTSLKTGIALISARPPQAVLSPIEIVDPKSEQRISALVSFYMPR